MNQKEWFVLGSRLVGLYCLALAVPSFLTYTTTIFVPPGYPEDMTRFYRVYGVLMLLTPLLLAWFGWYLIKRGTVVHELAYPGFSGVSSLNTEGLFTVGIKVYGVYLVAGSFVEGLKIFSSYIFVSNAPAYMSTAQELYGLQTNLLPTLGSATLGIFFFIWGQSLAHLAVERVKENER